MGEFFSEKVLKNFPRSNLIFRGSIFDLFLILMHFF